MKMARIKLAAVQKDFDTWAEVTEGRISLR